MFIEYDNGAEKRVNTFLITKGEILSQPYQNLAIGHK